MNEIRFTAHELHSAAQQAVTLALSTFDMALRDNLLQMARRLKTEADAIGCGDIPPGGRSSRSFAAKEKPGNTTFSVS